MIYMLLDLSVVINNVNLYHK